MNIPRLALWRNTPLKLHVTQGTRPGFILIGHGHVSSGIKPHYQALAYELGMRGYTTARFEPVNRVRVDKRVEARSLSTDAEQLEAVFDALDSEFGHGALLGYSTSAAIIHALRAEALISLLPVDLTVQKKSKLEQLSRSAGKPLNPYAQEIEKGTYSYERVKYVYPPAFWKDWDEWSTRLPRSIAENPAPKLYIASDIDRSAHPADVERKYLQHARERGSLSVITTKHRFEPETAGTIADVVSDWMESKGVLQRKGE